MLDRLLDTVGTDVLGVSLRWIAAESLARALVSDVQKASARVHDLVGAVKRFSYMDRAAAIEPIDIAQGLRDTVSVLRSKAFTKEATLTLDTHSGLAPVLAVGGELNQVWSNLVDNALDAIGTGGTVTVTAATISGRVTVTVVDDGPVFRSSCAKRSSTRSSPPSPWARHRSWPRHCAPSHAPPQRRNWRVVRARTDGVPRVVPRTRLVRFLGEMASIGSTQSARCSTP
jgi:hypothetical protein